MKNATLYIDLAFCLILLPLMIYAFPVERWWSVNWVFFCSFIVWLYTSYFTYRFFIVPNLFKGGRLRWYAIGVLVASVLVTLLISSVHITSPIHHIRRSFMEQSPTLLGVCDQVSKPFGSTILLWLCSVLPWEC